MRTASVLACIQIPPHVLHGNVSVLYLMYQFVITLLTHRTADNLTYLGEEDICSLHSLLLLLPIQDGLLLVYLHVEGLDLLGIMSHDDRTLEVLLHQITFMLTGQVIAPFTGELKLMASLNGLL